MGKMPPKDPFVCKIFPDRAKFHFTGKRESSVDIRQHMSGFVEEPLIVDGFEAPESWMPVASGLAELKLDNPESPRGRSLRMSFDFHGGGGFVVARKEIRIPLSETWEFRFRLRGKVRPNRFEFKIVDPSGTNVWRWSEEPLVVSDDWRDLVIPSSRMPFAWGPAGGGVPAEIGVIEFAIAAGEGGAGALSIEDFQWVDTGPLVAVSCQASSGKPDSLLTGDGWSSSAGDETPWVELDFGRPRELGGLILHWQRNGARDLKIEALHDREWRKALELQRVHGTRTAVPLQCPATQRIRLTFQPGAALESIEWKGPEFSRSDDEFLHAIATSSEPGAFPKYWLRRQTLLTPIGSPRGGPQSMMNEEGLVEIDAASPSVEPFLHDGERLWTWNDAILHQSLEDGWMPLPRSHWSCGELSLEVAAEPAEGGTLVRYTIGNSSSQPRAIQLHLAIRPFQATPPWQHHGHLGGKSTISSIEFDGQVCVLNGDRRIIPMSPPDQTAAQPFASGPLVENLRNGNPPASPTAVDPLDLAEAVITFRIDLPAGTSEERSVFLPFESSSAAPEKPVLKAVKRQWNEALAQTRFDVPPEWEDAAQAWKTAAAHILVNRHGAAIHPGPRRYTRAWIRDGVVMGAALARSGSVSPYVNFMRWYEPFLRDDGFVPCCVDEKGPDWLVEYDSQGQWLYGIAECHRFGAGDSFANDLWPSALRCIHHTRELLESQPLEGDDLPDKRAFHGLLPESASHEGYLAHPVHSYWDDFWAIRGLIDIQRLAKHLARPESEQSMIEEMTSSLIASVRKSLRLTMQLREIPYIPGSVEWADFDPAATAVAMMILDGLDVLPAEGLQDTFDRYLKGFRDRISGTMPWNNYSAYEMRIVSALTRLGRRADAIELLTFLLQDRRPAVWNQWPEITWKDPQSPGHFGDLPHTWIGAEYVLGFAGLFAHERAADDTLVLAAGMPLEWFANGRTNGVSQFSTYYGPVTFSLKLSGGKWHLDLTRPPTSPGGGIEVRLPLVPGVSLLHHNGNDLPIDPLGIVRL
jgi:hypothetical protein